MKSALFLFSILFSFTALAVEHKPCDLSKAGFKDKKEFVKFFGRLQAAVAANDEDALSKMANYPLRVGKGRIKNETELKKKFSTVFTPKILSLISSQKIEDLFCDYEGAKIGKNKTQIWVQEVERVIVITTINK